MTDYNKYIAQLKKDKADIDYDRMFARVLQRRSRNPRGMRLAVAGALAVLLIGFGVYFISGQSSRLASSTKEDALTTYVFEESEDIDGPLLDYVLCAW